MSCISEDTENSFKDRHHGSRLVRRANESPLLGRSPADPEREETPVKIAVLGPPWHDFVLPNEGEKRSVDPRSWVSMILLTVLTYC